MCDFLTLLLSWSGSGCYNRTQETGSLTEERGLFWLAIMDVQEHGPGISQASVEGHMLHAWGKGERQAGVCGREEGTKEHF